MSAVMRINQNIKVILMIAFANFQDKEYVEEIVFKTGLSYSSLFHIWK